MQFQLSQVILLLSHHSLPVSTFLFNSTGFHKGYRYVERSTFAGWRSWGDARTLYSAVKAPVKLIYGQHDWSTLDERKRTAKALGGIDITTIANTGYFAFVDNPNGLLALLLP